jgi:hypothetical protein
MRAKPKIVAPPEEFSLEREDITTRVNRRESAEQLFASQCRSYRLPKFITQHMFALEELGRKWKFDVAFPEYRVAIEIEGLVVQRLHVATLDDAGKIQKLELKTIVTGRHATVQGFTEDCEKYANAAALGWTVVRFAQKQVASSYAVQLTQRALFARGWGGPK